MSDRLITALDNGKHACAASPGGCGLQDNIELAVRLWGPSYLKRFAGLVWMDTIRFLLALLVLPFSVLWDQARAGFRIRV